MIQVIGAVLYRLRYLLIHFFSTIGTIEVSLVQFQDEDMLYLFQVDWYEPYYLFLMTILYILIAHIYASW